MKTKAVQLLFFVLLFGDSNAVFATSIENGKALFTTRCTSCHNVNAQLVGPALAGVENRRTVEWLVNFIRSPKTLIEEKDKDAVALYDQFNHVMMPEHQDVSPGDVNNILAYIKSEAKIPASEVAAPFAKPGKIVPDYHPLSFTTHAWFFMSYLFAVVVLVLSLIFAVNIKEMKRDVGKANS